MGKKDCHIRTSILDTQKQNGIQAEASGLVKREDPQYKTDPDVHDALKDAIKGNIQAIADLSDDLQKHEAECEECKKGE